MFLPWTAQVTVILVLLSAAPAQQSARPRSAGFATTGELGRTPTLEWIDGVPYAIGSDYRARFVHGGLEFTPVLGQRAPHNLPLFVRLVSIERRGGSRVSFPGEESAPPETRKGGVVYSRTACAECYDIGAAGIEQSFRFDRLPPGDGDLVVTLEVRTDLPSPSHDDDTGLTFAVPGLGGVQVGLVVGIDAVGEQCAGSIGLKDKHIELALPGNFVDSAELPLLLDPLFGTVAPVGAGQSARVDAAHDATTDEYLAVWEQVVSGMDSDILAQRIGGDGVPRGAIIAVRVSSSLTSRAPRVTGIGMRDTFVIVWHETPISGRTNWDVLARRVGAGTGTRSSTITIGAGGGTQIDPDIGSRPNSPSDTAIAVWVDRVSGDTLYASQVFATATGGLGLGFRTPLITAGASVQGPRISSQSRPGGQQVVVWRSDGRCGTDCRILAQRTGRVAPPIEIAAAGAGNVAIEGHPGVDEWLIAYEHTEAGNPSSRDIRCVQLNSSLMIEDERTLAGDPGEDESQPTVARMSDAWLVGFRDQIGTAVRTSVMAVGDRCSTCERTLLDSGRPFNTSTTVAVAGSSALASAQSLCVWDTGTGGLYAQRYRLEAGIVGGYFLPCSVGRAGAFCARVGEASEHWVEGAAPNQNAWLVLSPSVFNRSVGLRPCPIVPDPFLGFVVDAGPTDGDGSARVLLPIPSAPELAGAQLYEQWVVAQDVSTALFVTIQ